MYYLLHWQVLLFIVFLKVYTVLTEFPEDEKKELYKIHPIVVHVDGNPCHVVEWDTDERDVNLVDVKLMNEHYPQEVIEFYEKHLSFGPPNTLPL